MGTFLVRRLIHLILTLFVVFTAVFLFLHIIPGDPAVMVLGGMDANPTPEQLESVRKELGLNLPLHIQYAHWLKKTFTGDLGTSFVHEYSVSVEVAKRLPRTLQLILPAMLLGIVFGVPMGIIAALHRGKIIDPVISVVALVGFSLPVFILGTMLVLVVSIKLGWLPPSGYTPVSQGLAAAVSRSLLPVSTLAVAPMAMIMRMTRSSVLETLSLDYVTTARSKGLREWRVILKHVLRTSLIPIVTIAGLRMGAMFGGSVIVERIFNWPGIGQLLLNGIGRRDYPVVQGVVLLVALVFSLINLVTDLTYAFLDPRISHD